MAFQRSFAVYFKARTHEIDIGCLNVTIECKTFSEIICDSVLCVKRIIGISCTILIDMDEISVIKIIQSLIVIVLRQTLG